MDRLTPRSQERLLLYNRLGFDSKGEVCRIPTPYTPSPPLPLASHPPLTGNYRGLSLHAGDGGGFSSPLSSLPVYRERNWRTHKECPYQVR